MSTVKIVSGKGFNEVEAFATKANFKVVRNATTAWKKAGSPVGDELKAFAAKYLQNATKSVPGAGCVISVKSGVEDSRERPYKTEVIATTQKRKYKTEYEIRDTDKKVLGSKDKKGDALKLAKQLVTELKRDVIIYPVKVVAEGEAIAATIKYEPSINATEGSYIFFGVEVE